MTTTKTFWAEVGTDFRYHKHTDGVFTFYAIPYCGGYSVSFDRIDAGKGKEYGWFASLAVAESFITSRKNNYYKD
jgi:hypothetical protein